jgi:pyruvate/2-oxoglutarate dehydrogenase complex dihydrolipoamide acyltransferase (E2) component
MGGDLIQQIIFSAATLLLCTFFFVYFYFYIRRRTSRGAILADYRDEVNHLIAEIDHATDRDARLVEERITALRKVLEDADRRIALLSRDMERRAGPGLYPESRQPAAGPTAASPAEAPRPSPPLDAAGTPAPARPPTVPQARPLTEQAAELSRRGFSADLIAARLGVSLSEVELALAVYRRTGA